MVIKLLLTLGLLVALFFSMAQQASTRLLRMAMILLVALGVVLVWFPDITMSVAGLVGVGRGTDLITYLWIVISIIFILILHLRINRLNATITDLARGVSISEATRNRDEDGGEGEPPVER